MNTPARTRVPLPLLITLLTLLLVLPAALLLAPRLLNRSTPSSPLFERTAPVADFTLTRADTGQSVALSSLRGKVVVLYFGYTFCPDVCPMTLAKLAQARGLLGDQASDLQVAMVTVDPERDTPSVLTRYVTNFDPSFLGLIGTPEQLAPATTALGIYVKRNEGTAATGYLVDHTAHAMVIDRQGYLRLVMPPTLEGPTMANDLRVVLGQ
jgi:protein SCO1/2